MTTPNLSLFYHISQLIINLTQIDSRIGWNFSFYYNTY